MSCSRSPDPDEVHSTGSYLSDLQQHLERLERLEEQVMDKLGQIEEMLRAPVPGPYHGAKRRGGVK
jgi:hypothetical protein